jgi:hypothetical protein
VQGNQERVRIAQASLAEVDYFQLILAGAARLFWAFISNSNPLFSDTSR